MRLAVSSLRARRDTSRPRESGGPGRWSVQLDHAVSPAGPAVSPAGPVSSRTAWRPRPPCEPAESGATRATPPPPNPPHTRPTRCPDTVRPTRIPRRVPVPTGPCGLGRAAASGESPGPRRGIRVGRASESPRSGAAAPAPGASDRRVVGRVAVALLPRRRRRRRCVRVTVRVMVRVMV